MGILGDLTRRYYRAKGRLRHAQRRALETAFGEMSARYYRDSWEHAAQAVGAHVEDMGNALLKIQKGQQSTFVRRHAVMLDSFLAREILLDKSLIHRILEDLGWSPPPHRVFDCRDIKSARTFMEDTGKVVVKPLRFSRGDGVTTNVDNVVQLRQARAWAAGFDRSLIVEKHVAGDLYRLLFLDAELIATVRRDPPSLVGDGAHTIRQLVDLANVERLRGCPYTSLIPLTLDLESHFTLQRQGLTSSSVLNSGERVPLKSVINQNAAQDNHTVHEGIHPSLQELGRRISARLSLRLFGLDVITTDISSSLDKTGGAHIEINIPPGLHYHDLVADRDSRVPVGEPVLKAIFDGPRSALEDRQSSPATSHAGGSSSGGS